ncbi:MAG TPA: chemotaxis protein CheX [Bdellovibrionota bacterium]|jgi:chemotaxis protein CheX|nr:chemotaxis protein CheX [Bdellovibrionota bacterium]
MSISIKNNPKYLQLICDSKSVTEADAKEAIMALKDIEEWRPLTVLDFSTADVAELAAFRTLTRILGTAAQNESTVAVVAKKPVRQIISENGLERLLPCYGSMDELVDQSGGGDPKKKALEFLNTTLEAVAKTIEVTLSVKVKAGKPSISTVKGMPEVDIGSVVGLIGTAFSGTLIMAYPQQTYLKIMSKMLGETFTSVSPAIRDGAAEILNMVLGQAKMSLNEKGYGIKQAIPTVVQGKDISIFSASNQPSVIVPFECELGMFFVELATTRQAAG